MILVAGGDSFVFGAELSDQYKYIPSQKTYAALLAKQANLDYKCVAWPGNANNAIGRMTMTACESLKKENDVIAIVTWSFTNRYEFRFNYHTGQKITPWYSINSWSMLDDTNSIEQEYKSKNEAILAQQKEHIERAKLLGIADFAKTFFMHVGNNEYFELYSTYKEILFLQQYFEQNNIAYIFLPADNQFYNHPNYYRSRDEYLDCLYNQIKWNHWFFFPPSTNENDTKIERGFYQWAIENKYPVGTTHPLDEAHIAACNLMKDKFNALVKKIVV